MAGKPGFLTFKLKSACRIRVRCEEDHKPDPWLRNLYVLWAVPLHEPAEKEISSQGESEKDNPESSKDIPTQVYYLAKSNSSGYLIPISTGGEEIPDRALPLVKDHLYHFYFVRHPSDDLPLRIIEELNSTKEKIIIGGKKQQEIKIEEMTTGKDKNGKAIKEGVIKIPCKSEAYVPAGSELYGGWTLFRNMPGTGWNTKDKDIQCPDLKVQVRRLQYHLGAMRYIVGNQWHPYSPEPWPGSKPKENTFPNEGVFDVLTWNSVIAFQRDARTGNACELDTSELKYTTVNRRNVTGPERKWFEPEPRSNKEEIIDSPNYISNKNAEDKKARFDISPEVESIVEKCTGDAIKSWLKNGLRKPGNILVAYSNDVQKEDWIFIAAWMHQNIYQKINLIDGDLKKWGFKKGLQFVGSFRDIRQDIFGAGPGRIVFSIHKSGYAFDFLMDNFIGPFKEKDPVKSYPIYFVKDEPEKGKIYWVIYGKVDKEITPSDVNELSKPAHIEYVPRISPWHYDATMKDGGVSNSPIEGPFLNISRAAQEHGLMRIPAYSKGWQQGTLSFTLSDDQDFVDFFTSFGEALRFMDLLPSADRYATINGEKYSIDSLKGLYEKLNLWMSLAWRHGAMPEVYVNPNTPEGEGFVIFLRGVDFSGMSMKARVEVNGEWKGGAGSSNVIFDKGKNLTKADLDLGPETEFPGQLFLIYPVTNPVTLRRFSVIVFPAPGYPSYMEWWHFEFSDSIHGKSWDELLSDIGWTREGLLGKQGIGDHGIHGFWGLGYRTGKKGLNTAVFSKFLQLKG